jgi:hypothetical protein
MKRLPMSQLSKLFVSFENACSDGKVSQPANKAVQVAVGTGGAWRRVGIIAIQLTHSAKASPWVQVLR